MQDGSLENFKKKSNFWQNMQNKQIPDYQKIFFYKDCLIPDRQIKKKDSMFDCL